MSQFSLDPNKVTGLELKIKRINFEKTRDHFATQPRGTKYTIQIVLFREIKDYKEERKMPISLFHNFTKFRAHQTFCNNCFLPQNITHGHQETA